jgi:DNA polymerase III alpha subunit
VRELRIGLQALKGLTAGALAALAAARERDGPFHSLADLRRRTGLAPGDLRVLIQAGACDTVAGGRTRPQLMWLVDSDPQRGGPAEAQGGLGLGDELPAPPLAEYDAARQLRDEYAVLGYLASCHPMTLFADTLRAIRPVSAPRLREHVGAVVTCAGMLTTAKPVHTVRDEPMEFVTFDDGHGLIETVIFPDVYRRVAALMFGPGPYLLRGRVEQSYGAITLTVTALERLDRYARRRGLP